MKRCSYFLFQHGITTYRDLEWKVYQEGQYLPIIVLALKTTAALLHMRDAKGLLDFLLLNVK